MIRRQRSNERSSEVVDLTDDLALTFQLLDDTTVWRHRLVERAVLSDGDHLSASSSYQLELPPDLMRPFVGVEQHGRRVRLLLPLTTKPKRPLLEFSMDGPAGSSAPLLLRSSIAYIQASYLSELVLTSPARSVLREGLTREVLEAVCAFTPAVFREYRTPRRHVLAVGRQPRTLVSIYRAYLQDGLGFDVPARSVERWLAAQGSAADHLVEALGEKPDPLSSSEQILLAVPRLHDLLGDVDDVDRVVMQYARAVRAAATSGDEHLLTALAEYGRRWEVITEVEVPLQEPFQITIHESRPIDVTWRGWMRQRDAFALRDARSGHLEIRVTDPHVNIVGKDVRDPAAGQLVGIPLLEAARHTRESFALYSSDPARPYYVAAAIRLRVIPEIRVAQWVVSALTLGATVFAVEAPDGRDLVDTLALLTVPTTFAAALVLVRESSALAIRLQARGRAVVAALTGALWAVALLRLTEHF